MLWYFRAFHVFVFLLTTIHRPLREWYIISSAVHYWTEANQDQTYGSAHVRASLGFLDSPSQSKMKGLRRLYHRDRPLQHKNRPTRSNDKGATKTEWGVLGFLNLLFLELNFLLLVFLLYSFLFTGFIRYWFLAYGLFRLIVGSLDRAKPLSKRREHPSVVRRLSFVFNSSSKRGRNTKVRKLISSNTQRDIRVTWNYHLFVYVFNNSRRKILSCDERKLIETEIRRRRLSFFTKNFYFYHFLDKKLRLHMKIKTFADDIYFTLYDWAYQLANFRLSRVFLWEIENGTESIAKQSR
jgi:hypothetical protein